MPGDALPGHADGDGEHLQHDAGPAEGEDARAKPRSPEGNFVIGQPKHSKSIILWTNNQYKIWGES